MSQEETIVTRLDMPQALAHIAALAAAVDAYAHALNVARFRATSHDAKTVFGNAIITGQMALAAARRDGALS